MECEFVVLPIVVVFSLFAVKSSSLETLPRHGEYPCPDSKTLTFHWLPYGEEVKYNNKSGKMEGDLPEFMSNAIQFCCPSVKLKYTPMNVESSKDIELSIRADRSPGLSLYFPVFANKYQQEKYQRPFIGFYDSPGPIIFVNEKSTDNGAIFKAMTKSWQIPALCVLLAAISGVILWFLDHKSNKKEFPQEFHRGSCVGLWWAFVTMTTVGYGDIAPKSFRGRLFAVLWMIIGTIALTLFNAQLTALITSSEIPTEMILIGKKIIIPRGGKPFMEQELNLGAEYQEEDFSTIVQMIRDKTDDILLMYDYEKIKLASSFGKRATHKSSIKLIKTIDHRFTIGITASGNITSTDKFLKCIEREIVDEIVAKKHALFKFLNKVMPTQSPSANTQGTEQKYPFETVATLAACSILILLVALGLVLEFCGKRGETQHGMRGERLTAPEDNGWYRESSWPTAKTAKEV